MLASLRERRGGRFERLLLACFNLLVINLLLLLAMAPVVTLPLGLVCASETIYEWRHHGEEFLVATFVRLLRERSRQKLVTGWVGVGLVAWSVLVVVEGAELRAPWHYVVAAVGLCLLGLSVAAGWFMMNLAWSTRARTREVLRASVLLAGRAPVVSLALGLLSLLTLGAVLVDPLLLLPGTLGLAGLAGQVLVERAMARVNAVLGSDPGGRGADGMNA